MKRLPLHHLHRLRHKLRRAMTTADDRQRLRLIDEFCCRRPPPQPRDPMKIAFLVLLGAVIGLFLFAVTSCATIETTVTTPDGTVTVTKTTAPDAASVTALAGTAQAFAPRAVVIREK